MKRIKSSYWTGFIFWIIGDLFIGALIPIWNIFSKRLDESQVILLTSSVILVFICAEILLDVKKLIDAEERKTILWETLDEFDKGISVVRKCFHDITEHREVDPDLFQKYFEHEAAHFQSIIYSTSVNYELTIDQRHFANTKIALECFQGGHDDIFRAVHLFKDNNFFTEDYPKEYSQAIAKKVKRGDIKQVKRLLIYQNDDELHSDLSLRIIKAHMTRKKYSYKLIRFDKYIGLLGNEELKEDLPDFGIYGNRYLYRALVSKPNEIRGTWTKSKDTISQYIDFFNECFDTSFSDTAEGLGIDLSSVVPL